MRSFESFKLALNALGDMTVAEYRQKYLRSRVRPGTHIQLANSKKTALPKEVDWRKAGVVTPVKNQGFSPILFWFDKHFVLPGYMSS